MTREPRKFRRNIRNIILLEEFLAPTQETHDDSLQRSVTIRNVSNAVAKFQLDCSGSSTFKVAIKRTKLAPGLHVRMMIEFKSEQPFDTDDERIVVKVENGKPVVIIVNAYRDPPILKSVSIVAQDPRRIHYESVSLIEARDSCEDSSLSSWSLGTFDNEMTGGVRKISTKLPFLSSTRLYLPFIL